jgi:hypothetical protein
MLGLIVAALTSCANPSILSAGIQSVATNGALKHYTIAITVANQGNIRQPSNLLQSVFVFQDGQKVDEIGLKPLRPKQTQKVSYSFDRAADAGAQTMDLMFTLDLNGRSGNNVDCHAGNESFAITV